MLAWGNRFMSRLRSSGLTRLASLPIRLRCLRFRFSTCTPRCSVVVGHDRFNRRTIPSPVIESSLRPILNRLSWGSCPFSVCKSRCAVQGRHALRRSRFDVQPSCHTAGGQCSSKGFILAVFRFASHMRGSRRRLTLHADSSGSCAAAFLSRGVPLPVNESCTTGPDLLGLQSGNTPGIREPFAVFPARGSRRLHPAHCSARMFVRRSSPLAVCRSV